MRNLLLGALLAFGVSLGAAQIGPVRPSGGGTIIPTSARIAFLAACPTGFTQDATLSGFMLLGTTAAEGDVGQTGGSNDLTPTGSVSTPSFTGNAVSSSAVSAGTPAGTVAAPIFTGDAVNTSAVSAGTPAGSVSQPNLTMNSYTPQGTNGTSSTTATGTIAWPAGVPTHSGTTASFSGNALGTHQHELPLHGGTAPRITAGYGTGSSVAATRSLTNASNTTSANVQLSQAVSAGTPTGTVTITSQGTIAWPAGVPTFSGSSSTVSAQTFTGQAATLTGTVSQPSFTGSALGNHQHTATATGTNSAPSFTGSALSTHQHATTATGSISTPLFTGDVADNRSAFTKVIWCRVAGAEPAPAAQTMTWLPIVAVAFGSGLVAALLPVGRRR